MALYIKDDAVNELAVEYQRATGAFSKTEAVRKALETALAEFQQDRPLLEVT
ncbi:type II toxin-antitoxin system VapB family antitoxin [Litoreibacter albidus]|uniref:type II toxin-antitoxin system VapB family antitoxin n=1 Tax=Litoreibacter albidus TaxID=670155 RepID=UPI003736783D